MANPTVRVGPLPGWLPIARLLPVGEWRRDGPCVEAVLDRADAADVAARLRGLGFDGVPIVVTVRPRLSRTAVRAGRTRDARARRDTSTGFLKAGARLDAEGKFSLTAETIALAMGHRAADQLGPGAVVYDAFCGCGGNAIGFARAGLRVVAVESSPKRLALARHNIALYDVADRVRLVHGDSHELAATQQADLYFGDPPWGEDWSRSRMGLDDLEGGSQILRSAQWFPHAWLKVPSSLDTRTLPGWRAHPWFGVSAGDRHRVKFLVLNRTPTSPEITNP